MALWIPTSDDIMVNHFRAGLPACIQGQIMLISRYYDTVVSIVLRLSATQQTTSTERFHQTQEDGTLNREAASTGARYSSPRYVANISTAEVI